MTGYVFGESECIEKINLALKADELKQRDPRKMQGSNQGQKIKNTKDFNQTGQSNQWKACHMLSG